MIVKDQGLFLVFAISTCLFVNSLTCWEYYWATNPFWIGLSYTDKDGFLSYICLLVLFFEIQQPIKVPLYLFGYTVWESVCIYILPWDVVIVGATSGLFFTVLDRGLF